MAERRITGIDTTQADGMILLGVDERGPFRGHASPRSARVALWVFATMERVRMDWYLARFDARVARTRLYGMVRRWRNV